MDSLSQLVQMLSPSGSVDLRCRYAGHWLLEHEAAPPGYVPYHLILEGTARVGMAARWQTLQAGDVVLFPHGAAHRIRSLGGGAAPPSVEEPPTTRRYNGWLTEIDRPGSGPALEMLCGTFALGQSGSLLLRGLPPLLRVRSAGARGLGALRALIGLMRQEADAEIPAPGAAAIVGELSTVLFTLLLRALLAEGGLSQGLLNLLGDARLAGAVQAVLGEPARDWTIATMAERSHLSRAAFARRFAQAGGMTPLELLTGLRMELAARLLRQDALSVGIVAERSGYASQAAFGRLFKAHFGLTPGAFQRRLQQQRQLPRYRSTASLAP